MDTVADIWIIGGIISLASLIQSLTGFGFALVAVSFLPLLLDLQTIVPLVVLTSMVGNITLCWHYRDSFDWRAVVRLLVAALPTIPLGILVLQYVPEQFALRVLGCIVLTYVLYDGLKFTLPKLLSPHWAYAFGAMAGVLIGAFNAGGPPIVIYANCNRWSPERFRSNIPGVFLASALVAITGHYFRGNLTVDLLRMALYVTPFFVSGLLLGIFLSKRIDASVFRQIVLVLLGIMSLRLMW
ncbi:MAG: sulfite exporter TauE/SafE family protein [Cyanobacteria bacterium P01_A01_bin.123]